MTASATSWATFRKREKAAAEAAEAAAAEPNPRVMYFVNAIRGVEVEIRLRSGDILQGVVGEVHLAPHPAVLLRAAKKRGSDGAEPRDITLKGSAIVSMRTLLAIRLKDAEKGERAKRAAAEGKAAAGAAFATDTQISGASGRGAGRELQRWVPDEDDSDALEPATSSGLVDPKAKRGDVGSGGAGGWDQFQTNERLFGVKSTFNMDAYTTKVDMTKAKISLAEADRIAREIEGKKSHGNMHLAEERGQIIDGTSGDVLDEEDRYSSVLDQSRGGITQSTTPGKDAPVPADKKNTGGNGAAAAASPSPTRAPATSAPGNSSGEQHGNGGATCTTSTDDGGGRGNQAGATGAAGKTVSTTTSAAAAAVKPKPPTSKLNANAKEFKLNANAAAFTPGAKKTVVAPAPVVTPMAPQPYQHQMMQPPFVGNVAADYGMYGVPVMPAAMTGPFFTPTAQAPVMLNYAGGQHHQHHQPGPPPPPPA